MHVDMSLWFAPSLSLIAKAQRTSRLVPQISFHAFLVGLGPLGEPSSSILRRNNIGKFQCPKAAGRDSLLSQTSFGRSHLLGAIGELGELWQMLI